MTQGEFSNILDTKIRPFVSTLITNAALAKNKVDYIKDAWDELYNHLSQFNFDDKTFKDLNVRYRNKIQDEVRKKYIL